MYGLSTNRANMEGASCPPPVPEHMINEVKKRERERAIEDDENKFEAQFSPYVSAKVGYGIADSWWEEFDDDAFSLTPFGRSYSFAAGYEIKTSAVNLRAEFEYAAYNLKDKDYDDFGTWPTGFTKLWMKADTYMGNFYADFLEKYFLKPYVDVGAKAVGLNSGRWEGWSMLGFYAGLQYEF